MSSREEKIYNAWYKQRTWQHSFSAWLKQRDYISILPKRLHIFSICMFEEILGRAGTVLSCGAAGRAQPKYRNWVSPY